MVWLVLVVVAVALGAWLLLAREARGSRVLPYVPAEAELARARELLNPSSPPTPENQRRLVFYDSLRDRMDASEFGVLEAVALLLRQAPGQQVSPGFDLRTFYSAVGGDRDFRGALDEDWSRLKDFQTRWLEALPGSLTARVARARSSVIASTSRQTGGPAASPGEALSRALADLGEAHQASIQDPFVEVEIQRLLRVACAAGERGPARAAFEMLGPRVDPAPWAGTLESYRTWALGKGSLPATTVRLVP